MQVHPYLMESNNATVKPANETSSPWQGFLADYIESLAEIGNFNYSLRLFPDGKYGELLTGNKWNGLMGEVVNNVCMPHIYWYDYFDPRVVLSEITQRSFRDSRVIWLDTNN